MHLKISYKMKGEDLEQILNFVGEVFVNERVVLSRVLMHHEHDVAGDWSIMDSTEMQQQISQLGISDIKWTAD